MQRNGSFETPGVSNFKQINPSFSPFFGSKEDISLYLKEQVKRVFNKMVEDSKQMTTTCNDCHKKFDSEHSLRCHLYRESLKLPELRCGYKEERKRRKVQEISEKKEKDKKAKLQLAELDASEVLEKVNASSRTDELLEKIVQQNNVLVQQNNDLKEEVGEIKQQNEEMKEMVTEFARNPKLIVLVDKLYPIQSLAAREIDLKTPAFKPVLEILENELPEYANLAQEKTGKVHCKAVRKLNEIQPTAVKDKEKVFYKEGDVITKFKKDEATKSFIDVFANSGYEYAQKASNDLKSIRESDEHFKKEILQHASRDILQNIEEII